MPRRGAVGEDRAALVGGPVAARVDDALSVKDVGLGGAGRGGGRRPSDDRHRTSSSIPSIYADTVKGLSCVERSRRAVPQGQTQAFGLPSGQADASPGHDEHGPVALLTPDLHRLPAGQGERPGGLRFLGGPDGEASAGPMVTRAGRAGHGPSQASGPLPVRLQSSQMSSLPALDDALCDPSPAALCASCSQARGGPCLTLDQETEGSNPSAPANHHSGNRSSVRLAARFLVWMSSRLSSQTSPEAPHRLHLTLADDVGVARGHGQARVAQDALDDQRVDALGQ